MSLDDLEAVRLNALYIQLEQMKLAIKSVNKTAQQLPDGHPVKETALWALEIAEPTEKGFSDVELSKISI